MIGYVCVVLRESDKTEEHDREKQKINFWYKIYNLL